MRWPKGQTSTDRDGTRCIAAVGEARIGAPSCGVRRALNAETFTWCTLESDVRGTHGRRDMNQAIPWFRGVSRAARTVETAGSDAHRAGMQAVA